MAPGRRVAANILGTLSLGLLAWPVWYGIQASEGEPMLGVAAALSVPFFWAVLAVSGLLAGLAAWLSRAKSVPAV